MTDHYTYLTKQDVNTPIGTQQLPAVVAKLNRLRNLGARIVYIQGDLEDEFVILLEPIE